MGGIISRFKKKPDEDASTPSVDTKVNDAHLQVPSPNSGDNSANSNSDKKKKGEGDESSPNKAAQQKIAAAEKLKNSTKKLIAVQQAATSKATAQSREVNKKFRRKQYLKERAAKLRGRLKDRPTDQRALQEYATVLYETEDYTTAPKVIKRVLATGDSSGDWHLKLGKCYFRRWARVGNLKGETDLISNHMSVDLT